MNKITKLLKIKGIGFILLAFLAGIILLLLPDGETKTSSDKISSAEYAVVIEESLEKLLKTACGVDCEVMVTLEGGYSYSYAANEKLDTEYAEGKPTSKTVSKEYVITSSNGEEKLVILKENLPEIKGVAVVCKKGGESERLKIITLVSALFDLPDNAIGCIVGA
ncbi:MAG: hypothetical protein E7614_07755 [Ruminococcaceae bacterium]|nr:hypothetical protein [Oscillospiraceae bacterium]